MLRGLRHMGRVNWWATMGERSLSFSPQSEGRWWSRQLRDKSGCEEKIKACLPFTTSWSWTEDQPIPKIGWLQSLNAKTGLFTKRMKIIHRDPKLHAQRVAAIKKAKGTAAARKHASETLKAFFSDPENRQKRSIAMKGVRFYCKHCGREGHRKFYCPELKDGLTDRGFKCRLCGERGHNRRTCPKSRLSYHNGTVSKHHRCQICRQRGHNRRTCPQVTGEKRHDNNGQKHIPTSASKTCTCRFCGEKGHNIRTCPRRNLEQLKSEEASQQASSFT